jgi:hypothetical protein
MLSGLGICFSRAQRSSSAAPFDPYAQYLKAVAKGELEPATRTFAEKCGIDLHNAQPKFAVSSGDDWAPVKNLARGLRSLDSDFYTSVEVWRVTDKTLVEMWPNDDSDGSNVRILRCYSGDKMVRADLVQWNLPMDPDPKFHPWGYVRVWRRDGSGGLQLLKAEFIDATGKAIAKPELDKDEEEGLKWIPQVNSLQELKLPPVLLK